MTEIGAGCPVLPPSRHAEIPRDRIEWKNSLFNFRLKKIRSRTSGARFGDSILTVETAQDGRYRILDGHRRLAWADQASDAPRQFSCHIFESAELSPVDRFHIIVAANGADKAQVYGLVEKARLVCAFEKMGVPLVDMMDVLQFSLHDADDFADIAAAPPVLARLLNRTTLAPALAAMLVRRHQGWLRIMDGARANFLARRILRSVTRETPTMKTWRFYLDFHGEPRRVPLATSLLA